MKILLLDNYDSFTYNLLHYLEMIDGVEVSVKRNDEIELDEIDSFDRIVLSPGPGLPEQAGKLKAVINRFANQKPILGICLGHQALGECFGAKLKNLGKVVHGKSIAMEVTDSDETLFSGLSERFNVGRYHSWVVDRESLGEDWKITAIDEDGEIMAFAHEKLALKGLQFHPESVLTENGLAMLENWVNQ